jgi:two-component system, NtrC family, response regulator PilR
LTRNVFALMVHDRPEPCQSLKLVLRRLGLDTFSVRSCAEAALLLEQTNPHLVFTDTKLPDGTWIDVVNLAEEAAAPICAILAGPSKDPELLRTALQIGAFDFISPPFDAEAISRLVAQAMILVRTRRDRRSRAAVA